MILVLHFEGIESQGHQGSTGPQLFKAWEVSVLQILWLTAATQETSSAFLLNAIIFRN